MKSFVSPYNFVNDVDLKVDPKKIIVYDTTLRDGEQTPGICFTPDEKIEIAVKLDELGVPQIEAGFPVVSDGERRAIRNIMKQSLNSEILALTRTIKSDIDVALSCDVDGIITFIGSSDLHLKYKLKMTREQALSKAVEAVEYGKSHGLFVAFTAEDSTRTDLDFILDLFRAATDAGADRVHIADTTGSIRPMGMKYLITQIKNNIDNTIGIHCHDDFGLAVANSLAAFEAGAMAISTTVNGIGERAGNASLEEIIMNLRMLYGIEMPFKYEVLYELSRLVEKYTTMPVPKNKAIVGDNVFSHESGIHVSAIRSEPLTYEPYTPEFVGQKRKIILGKHCGMSSIEYKLDELGLSVPESEKEILILKIKEMAERGAKVGDKEFKNMVQEVLSKV
ncbi:MAG TPA: homocitrate synthase family protein [Methanofastidiosum sp.]|nr:homocitrate synthase family protein [Methanofastidiosum sp.]HPA48819.1 homocitrate synthase family protein [Methanofastidiosum sp.]HQK62460.1 homocitrate synthase family protein [Methanofastidiosum sp.]HQM94274.1 homocitrate synthase family protein [Methanofastidiosum sp.]HQQ48762.1 homocitrate synthase family protein [Methanofastidiosum sp.]